jgi:outer membrane protein OmpU
MNNIKKIGLTALAGSLVAGSVSAATMSVSGSAGMSYTGGDSKATQGQGWTMGDSITFSASGDVNDIGVTLTMELDGDDADGGATSNQQFDNQSIAFDLGDAGTLTFHGHGGSSALGAKDDVMPTANEEPWDIVTGAEAEVVGGAGGNNMFAYSYAHESGLTGTVTYVNAADAVTDVSSTSYGLEFTGMEGLTVGYAQQDVEVTTNAKSDESTMYAKYAIGGITVGIQMSEKDSESGTDYETTGIGISYQVNDDLAVSYGNHEIEAVGAGTPDQEAAAVSFSYTMGSLGIVGTVHDGDNIANDSTDSREKYSLGLSFNF